MCRFCRHKELSKLLEEFTNQWNTATPSECIAETRRLKKLRSEMDSKGESTWLIDAKLHELRNLGWNGYKSWNQQQDLNLRPPTSEVVALPD